MIQAPFLMYSRDLLQSKITKLNFMFFGYGVHIPIVVLL